MGAHEHAGLILRVSGLFSPRIFCPMDTSHHGRTFCPTDDLPHGPPTPQILDVCSAIVGAMLIVALHTLRNTRQREECLGVSTPKRLPWGGRPRRKKFRFHHMTNTNADVRAVNSVREANRLWGESYIICSVASRYALSRL